MATIACPLCLGPTEVLTDGGRCQEGHDFDEADLVRAFQAKADSALWAAIRSLDDQAAFARLREREGRPVPLGARLAAEHVEALRELLTARAESGG